MRAQTDALLAQHFAGRRAVPPQLRGAADRLLVSRRKYKLSLNRPGMSGLDSEKGAGAQVVPRVPRAA